MIPEEVLSILKNAKSFAKMASALDGYLRAEHGIKGFQMTGLAYSDTILHPSASELKRGWACRVAITVPPSHSLFEVLKLLAAAHIHVGTGSITAVRQQSAHISVSAEAYMLGDEWESMAVRRRFNGHDAKTGQQVMHEFGRNRDA